VRTAHGVCTLKVVVSDGQRRGSIFVPIHWSDETASCARVGDLVGSDVDPVSGQPEMKTTPAAVAPTAFRFHGFALARRPVALPAGTWWSRVAIEGGLGYVLATNENPEGWRAFAPHLLGDNAVVTEYLDRPNGLYRVAAFIDGRLACCLFIGPVAAGEQWEAARHVFEARQPDDDAPLRPTAESVAPAQNRGPTVCTCFGIGLAAIRQAIISTAAAGTEEIGRALHAGTKCGTCLPELRSILAIAGVS
jgi:assimilatory nitrate reductase catalytic subunit